MESTTLIGLLAGAACIVISIFIGGQLGNFYDIASIFIVLGGTVCSTIVAYPGKVLRSLMTVYKNAFLKKEIDLEKDIEIIIHIADTARREGLLALENAIDEIQDDFLKKGIMLVVDGTDPEMIRTIMDTEIYYVQERHARGQAVIDSMAAFAPAYGMIGTLIGLINMLKNLSDTDSLGPGMATALITTFYGVILANLVFTPISKKLKLQTANETREKELLLEGLLAIQDGENSRIIRDRLVSFISRNEIHKDANGREEVRTEIRGSSNGRQY